jgi:hypothetical protein
VREQFRFCLPVMAVITSETGKIIKSGIGLMDQVVDQDFYFEDGLMVMTAQYHLKRGYCCGSGCRHCPYIPKHQAGSTTSESLGVGESGNPGVEESGSRGVGES